MEQIRKYPRTRHLEGSGLQADDDPTTAAWSELAAQDLVVAEKMDGANCGISFDSDQRIRLQSRGHYLTGGPRERQFDLLKRWAARHATTLWDTLGDRYILYGEWLYGKHSIFYTDLPHYFMEFDMLDTQSNRFLTTAQRQQILANCPIIASVKVLYRGQVRSLAALTKLVGHSEFIASNHRQQLVEAAQAANLEAGPLLNETDPSGLIEGLYIKIEHQGAVQSRFKYVRPGFLQTVLDSGSHWMDRPLFPNRLRAGVELW
jgi:hypothetical protein